MGRNPYENRERNSTVRRSKTERERKKVGRIEASRELERDRTRNKILGGHKGGKNPSTAICWSTRKGNENCRHRRLGEVFIGIGRGSSTTRKPSSLTLDVDSDGKKGFNSFFMLRFMVVDNIIPDRTGCRALCLGPEAY